MFSENLAQEIQNWEAVSPVSNFSNLQLLSPYRIMSLLAMLRFYAHSFLGAFKILEYLNSLQKEDNQEVNLNPDMYSTLKRNMSGMCHELENMDLTMSLISAKKLKEETDLSPTLNAYTFKLIDELSIRIIDELESHLLLYMPAHRSKFYNPIPPIFDDEVNNKWPNLVYDITEAGNCYAVGRFTACVFHLMRIMEYAVQQIGIKITEKDGIEDKSWHTIIKKTKEEIEKKFTNEKDPKRIEWESILGHLQTVRIAWRNPTMHPKGTYTDEEAEDLIRAVKTLLREIVKII